jgi:hypothetical protein
MAIAQPLHFMQQTCPCTTFQVPVHVDACSVDVTRTCNSHHFNRTNTIVQTNKTWNVQRVETTTSNPFPLARHYCTSGLDFGNHAIGTVQRVPHEKPKQCHGQQNGAAHQQYCHTGFGACLARFPANDWCVPVGTLMAQFGSRGIVTNGATAVRQRMVARQCNWAGPKRVWVPRHCTVPVQGLQRGKRRQGIDCRAIRTVGASNTFPRGVVVVGVV